MTDPWYEQLRQLYRPRRLNVLLVAESPPALTDERRRFFYSPTLTIDNLFRGVAQAVYGEDVDCHAKLLVLTQLQADGFWLIDATDEPVNRKVPSERRRALQDALPALVERCVDLAPETGVIICHGGVFDVAASQLRMAGVHLLHDEPLPFPLGNWRQAFIKGFRACLGRGFI